jgi:predicted DNA-binding transcriptional regulator
MRRFTVRTEGQNTLRPRELCQRYVDERWIAANLTPEQAAESILDEFKRAVRQELEMLEVECVEVRAATWRRRLPGSDS